MKDLIQLKVSEILNQINHMAKSESKSTGFCIGNTKKINSTGMYFSPVRNSNRLVAGSVIVYSVDQARDVATYVDGKVDYILIDTEKKISPELYGSENVGNVERAVREVVKYSKILTYKGNDLTVDALERFVVELLSTNPRGLGGKKATIVGAGNIGSKLALKLVERGMNVILVRRDAVKLNSIVNALNIIKPAETIASVMGELDALNAVRDSNIVIGLTNGDAVITAEMIDLISPNTILLDAGKGCFQAAAIEQAEANGFNIYRADVRVGFEGHVSMAMDADSINYRGFGRRTIEGISIVSAGLLAKKEECVVNDIHNPTAVFGLADGSGDFIRNLSDAQFEKIKIIETYIAKQLNR